EPSCNVVQPDPGKENTWFCLSCDEDKRGIVAVFNSTQMDYLMIGRLAAHPESGETVFMAEREARANFLEEPTKQAMKAYCETGLEPNPNFIIDVNALRPEAERF